MVDPFIPRASGASPCNLFLLMRFWSVNLTGARPFSLQLATKRPIFLLLLLLCRCCTLCKARRGNLTSHRFQLCWPLPTLLLTSWHTICAFSVEFKGLQLQNFLWFYWHTFFCAVLHDFRDQQLQFFSIFTAVFKSLSFEVFHPSSVPRRLISIAISLPLLLQHLGHVPFFCSCRFEFACLISTALFIKQPSSDALFLCVLVPFALVTSNKMPSTAVHQFSQCIFLKHHHIIRGRPNIANLICCLMHFCPNAFATWPQSHRCNPAYSSFARSSHNLALQPFQSRVLLLTVNFLTHFDVCLVHLLLLMFRNRGFPTRCQPVYKHLSIYKHLLLAGETTSPNLTFLSSIKFCLDFSFSWLPILRFPCIIRFWSSTIGIPVHG